MGRRIVTTTVVCLGLLLAAPASGQVNVSIDQATRYQTIEGLGAGIHGFAPWKVKQGPFWVTVDMNSLHFYDSVVAGLGISLLRMLEDGTFEPDSASFAVTGYMGGQLGHARRFLDAAARQGETIRIITSILSPPAYMKPSGRVEGLMEAAPDYNTTDCKLKVGYDDVYGRFLVRYLQVVRDSLGVEEYGLSLQNEPAFQEPYASCVYNGARYTSVLKAVCASVRGASLSTRFFGAEHMSWSFPNPFEATVRSDPAALACMHAWAVHGYTDGVHADTGSYGSGSATDKPLWMSETSGSAFGTTTTDWPGAMTYAIQLQGYLRTGRISAWNFLHVMQNDGTAGAFYCDGQPTALYHAMRHFSRFIRPGSRQVASTSSSANVRAVAFRSDADTCLAIVLVNTGAAASVTLSGAGLPPSFEQVVSDATQKGVSTIVASSGAISLTASSITTLVAGRYRGSGSTGMSTPPAPAMSLARPVAASAVRTFTLAGQQVAQGAKLRSAGTFCLVPVNGRGQLAGKACISASVDR